MIRSILTTILAVLWAASAQAQIEQPLRTVDIPLLNLFVGFTSTTHDGDMSDEAGAVIPIDRQIVADGICKAEFPGSFVCPAGFSFLTDAEELNALVTWNTVISDGAWVAGACQSNGNSFARNNSTASDVVWLRDFGGGFREISFDLNALTPPAGCDLFKPLACCSRGVKEDVSYLPEPGFGTSTLAGFIALYLMGRA